MPGSGSLVPDELVPYLHDDGNRHDFSQAIHKFSFEGDGAVGRMNKAQYMLQYFLKVVSTQFRTLDGKRINTPSIQRDLSDGGQSNTPQNVYIQCGVTGVDFVFDYPPLPVLSNLLDTLSNRPLSPVNPQTSVLTVKHTEIYYRAGYTPTDYLAKSNYDMHFLLMRSKAIKCPSIPLQLAGGKKVQQVLAQPGVLERFVDTTGAEELRASLMEMWGLDEDDGIQKALQKHHALVLKAQREGASVFSFQQLCTVLDASSEPFNTAVKGFEDPSLHLFPRFIIRAYCPVQSYPSLASRAGRRNHHRLVLRIRARSGGPQYGFRRTELIAPSSFNLDMETGTM
ncbi:hypothetical protein BDZ89DRAFT_1133663 [Hymenopellis radicata]|nr:hypothetical protein BDZ89DRAFT_1133663 [Hymenopellis radicata]